jgi:hypothetical protein
MYKDKDLSSTKRPQLRFAMFAIVNRTLCCITKKRLILLTAFLRRTQATVTGFIQFSSRTLSQIREPTSSVVVIRMYTDIIPCT